MKKATFLMVALPVVAIASVSLAAFARFPNIFYKMGPDGKCTVQTILTLTTAPQPGQQGVITNLSTAPTQGPCTITVYTCA